MSHPDRHPLRFRAGAASRIDAVPPRSGRPAPASRRWRVLPMRLALLALLALLTGPAAAQPMPSVADARPALGSRPASPAPAVSLPIGEATHGLLALQRDGEAASATPRPLSGELAARSYQRYLKSFDHPIPASFGATIKSDK